MTIPTICCPRCQGKGSVPFLAGTTENSCTTRCPLCWGIGCIPVLEVVMESCNTLALHYWLCNCGGKAQRIHPSNHDVCQTCDLTEDRADLAPAEAVQSFFQSDYGLPLVLVEAT